METLDMPATGQLKSLDVDNGLALEDWRASGLGPCVAIYFDRQVVGEYPHSEEVSCLRAFVLEPAFRREPEYNDVGCPCSIICTLLTAQEP